MNSSKPVAPLRAPITQDFRTAIPPLIRKSVFFALAFGLFALSPVCRAQSDDSGKEPDIDSTIAVVRANMQADRAALITSGMNFNDKDGAAFWPIYKEYDYERSKVVDRRVAVIKEYTRKYPNLTDAEAKNMAEQMLDSETRLAALKQKYYKRFTKVLPPLTVTKFFQLEHRVDLMMDMQVESSLPPLTQAKYTEQAN
ncbi:MAG TPA: hypothetical protein VMU05_21120 [Dongiaceae bacterium]|nr:hypothetical protein [Dongiaceae bacterium]